MTERCSSCCVKPLSELRGGAEHTERDLGDLGVADNIPIWPKGHSPLPTGDLDAQGVGDGILFCSYSLLVRCTFMAGSQLGFGVCNCICNGTVAFSIRVLMLICSCPYP